MGFEPSSTAAPELTEQDRRSLLGSAIDLNALLALWYVAKHLSPPKRLPPPLDSTPADPLCCVMQQTSDQDLMAQLIVLPAVPKPVADIWEDAETMLYLRTGQTPASQQAAARVRKRSLTFRWDNGRLFKAVKDPKSGQYSYRIVPEPKDREELILTMHRELGHVGEKRTIAAMAQAYWWYGMTLDCRRLVSTCTLCDRVQASAPAEQQEMQTSPHDYGLFYRWGLDYVGELPPSAQGNRYALVFVDYYSKWIEVFPVPKADAETTVRLVLLNLVARYGTPGEVVCDNGAPFKGLFKEFCESRHIQTRYITPGLPRSNGLAERAVKTVKYALKKHAAEVKNASTWDTEGLAAILLGYRITPQSSTGLSPAQILFAQNPAVNADVYAARQPPVNYDDPVAAAKQLAARAEVAQQFGAQAVENLRLAHARNAARFKLVRSGLHFPRVYTYQEGDYVYLLHPEDKVPGGAIGIRARPEILKVVEVRPSGVLVLINQAGKQFRSHKEKVVPCTVTNVEGAVHPELFRPPASLPCTCCRGPERGDVMLLCDHCNAPYHTYCLDPPLDEVPEGDWLCPDCVRAGVTLPQVEERRDRYIPAPISRPNLELPGRTRRLKAQQLADEWHGKVVTRVKRDGRLQHGRMVFQGPTGTFWFRIHWEDEPPTEHTTRVLKSLGVVPEANAPPGLLDKPDPVQVLAMLPLADVNWSIRTPQDIGPRLERMLPGSSGLAHTIYSSLSRRARQAMTTKYPTTVVRSLLRVLDLSSLHTILDPWAASGAVIPGLQARLIPPHSSGTPPVLVANDRWGGSKLFYEPLEPFLYDKLHKSTGMDAVITIPPLPLADIALVTALYHADTLVCMYVPTTWLSNAPAYRLKLLLQHDAHNTLLTIAEVHDPSHCWVCFFASPESLLLRLRPDVLMINSHVVVDVSHV